MNDVNDVNEFVNKAFGAYLHNNAVRNTDGAILFNDKGILYAVKVVNPGSKHYVITRYREGIKRTCGEFRDGKLNGKWSVWYDDNTIEYDLDMVNGKPHGVARNYFKDGDIMTEQRFIKGVEIL